MLLVEPYKSEILPHWAFRTPKIAKKSSTHIYKMFLEYLQNNDFVGADMARKYLQMGFTRSRRYSNHPTGQKYDGAVPKELKGRSGAHGRYVLPQDVNHLISEKAESARIFKTQYDKARKNKKYLKMKEQFNTTLHSSEEHF